MFSFPGPEPDPSLPRQRRASSLNRLTRVRDPREAGRRNALFLCRCIVDEHDPNVYTFFNYSYWNSKRVDVAHRQEE
jgi:hypothetical protein